MGKHTPGPWHAVQVCNWWCLQTGPGYGDKSLLSSDEPIVFGGECYGDGGVTEAEAAANAQLCAAAPELLAACKASLAVLSISDYKGCIAQQSSQAAINAAEGRGQADE